MTNHAGQFLDVAFIYHSKEDGCWIAHSLRTDQLGSGSDMTRALADLLRGIRNLHDLSREDPSVAFLCEAPKDVQDRAAACKRLPGEIFEVAHKIAVGEWPADIEPFKSDVESGPFTAEVKESEPICQ